MSLPPIVEGDSLHIGVAVSDGASPLNLAGATIVSAAQSTAGVTVSGSAAITDAAAGAFGVLFAAGALKAGVYMLQARVTMPNGETQTVVTERQTVLPSVLP